MYPKYCLQKIEKKAHENAFEVSGYRYRLGRVFSSYIMHRTSKDCFRYIRMQLGESWRKVVKVGRVGGEGGAGRWPEFSGVVWVMKWQE